MFDFEDILDESVEAAPKIAKPLRRLEVAIDSVTIDPNNARSHGKRNLAAIKSSLLRFGQLKPIVVREQDGVCYAGNGVVASDIAKFVAVSCHDDIIEWLQPDWVYRVAEDVFARGSLRRRPSFDVVIGRVPRSAWRIFAKFHYMTADLPKGAKCFGAWVDGKLVAFKDNRARGRTCRSRRRRRRRTRSMD